MNIPTNTTDGQMEQNVAHIGVLVGDIHSLDLTNCIALTLIQAAPSPSHAWTRPRPGGQFRAAGKAVEGSAALDHQAPQERPVLRRGEGARTGLTPQKRCACDRLLAKGWAVSENPVFGT